MTLHNSGIIEKQIFYYSRLARHQRHQFPITCRSVHGELNIGSTAFNSTPKAQLVTPYTRFSPLTKSISLHATQQGNEGCHHHTQGTIDPIKHSDRERPSRPEKTYLQPWNTHQRIMTSVVLSFEFLQMQFVQP